MYQRAGEPALRLGEGEGEASNSRERELASYQVTPFEGSPAGKFLGGEAERALECRLRLRADRSGGGLAVLEQDHRRDGHDPVLLGETLLLVDVHLDELHLVLALLGDLLEDGRDRVAWTAPLGPEVDDDGCLGLQDFLFEGRFRDVECHETHSFLSCVSFANASGSTSEAPKPFPRLIPRGADLYTTSGQAGPQRARARDPRDVGARGDVRQPARSERRRPALQLRRRACDREQDGARRPHGLGTNAEGRLSALQGDARVSPALPERIRLSGTLDRGRCRAGPRAQ